MTQEMRLRCELRPGDIGMLVSLHGLLYAREYGWDITFEGYVAKTLGHFASPVDARKERLWLAETADRFVGSIGIVKHSEEVAQLRWLLLEPAFRGRGLGRRLMDEALAFVRTAGYRSVFLDTVKELTAAAKLYRAAGFELIAETKRTLWGGEVTEQRYELKLT